MRRALARALFVMGFGISCGCAQEGLWSLGFRANGTIDLEPGNDIVVGPELGYSNFDWAAHRLQFKFAYLSNRFEHAARSMKHSFRKNDPMQDYYLFSPTWHFRRRAIFDPISYLDLGYSHYDVEVASLGGLDNESWVVTPHLGLVVNMDGGGYGLSYSVGYNLIEKESTLIYPLRFALGFWALL